MTRAWLGLGIWVLGCGIGPSLGCAKARAQTVPDGPPLSVPAPPPRAIAPPEEPIVALAPPVELIPPAAPAPAPRPPASSRPAPVASVPATAASPAAPPAIEPPRPSPPTAVDVAEERRVREILRRAQRDIGRVTYNRLSAAGRSQHDQSKSLAEQAEQAIKDRNWVFAQTLADKAATLAAELVAR